MKAIHAETIGWVLFGEMLLFPVCVYALDYNITILRTLFLFSAASMILIYFFIHWLYPKMTKH